MLTINYRDPRPVYKQLEDELRTMILTGVIRAEERLPSVRELAATLVINPNTIQRAYRDLEAEGMLYSIPGKGSFASPTKSAADAHLDSIKAQLREAASKLLGLGVSREALVQLIQEVDNHD